MMVALVAGETLKKFKINDQSDSDRYGDSFEKAVSKLCPNQLGIFQTLKIMYTADGENEDYYIFINNFLAQTMSGKLRILIQKAEDLYSTKDKSTGPVITLLANFKSFEKIAKTLSFNNMKFRRSHIVIILHEPSSKELESIFKSFWKSWIVNANVITTDIDENTLKMVTFFPFANGCDYSYKPEIVNRYDKTRMNWESGIFYRRKTSDLKKCAVKAAYPFDLPPAVIVESDKKGSIAFSGYEVNVAAEICDQINAKLQINFFNSSDTYFKNETLSIERLLEYVSNGGADFALIFTSMLQSRSEYLTATRSFYSSSIVMVVPPGKSLSGFHKLTRPFTTGAWILLGVFTLTATIFLLTIEKTSKKLYNIFVSKHVRNPIMSLIIGILGQTSHKLPMQNFPRFILMKFLLLCLVIRSIYLGRVFYLLKSDLRDHHVETVEDVVQNNMVFYTYQSMFDRISDFKYFENVRAIKSFKVIEYMRKTFNEEFNGVVINSLDHVQYLNSLQRDKDNSNYLFLTAREVFMGNHNVYYFQLNHFLVDEFNKYIDLFTQAGLIEKWVDKYTIDKLDSLRRVDDGAKTLTLTHLSVAFYLLILGQLISFSIFLLECGCKLL